MDVVQDDNLATMLNGSMSTRSVGGDNKGACDRFYADMTAGHATRIQAINHCVAVVEGEMAALRERKSASPDDADVARALYDARHRMRMLRVEAGVEETVADRSLATFKDK